MESFPKPSGEEGNSCWDTLGGRETSNWHPKGSKGSRRASSIGGDPVLNYDLDMQGKDGRRRA
ncbi:hypothetical protein FOXG_21436 [Fusarium oxysporum f. sp. lycopersici 4287]|uniref:Uncharacterized protein n=1 Tax=Fusarium oxysporum f. sp. lycopersici (strain 4287 / CBS 123668 / FGSC 9935 / NRRL 34936) TaxID=426428 RepID=A0A0J9VY73_FUSO4|nr:hypothetical protein FOXG_21436 [Fusarium oxysporum f. sp. lycopersici 4287]KAI8406494.1 hypothetical protein FOFC_13964 [Fusarium oxysporum]KNB15691.1 hypothetical protein FOXG_21436 [Fusarium oxysporum f. sp. lycopersici 4287]